MITKEEMMPLLIDACPSFRPTYEGLNEFHGEILYYNLLDDFADHIFGLHYNNETRETQKVFEIIEKIKQEGDDEAKELILVYFFGGIDSNIRKLKLKTK
ncbi:MAG: hypothetical protein LC768_04530 [Acidobacteria bacterium]|nr:hypothetical protein [Acidobacteriota bacterium]MCA1637591.1 hypothetical protein [Acidobacteriota bacterium]